MIGKQRLKVPLKLIQAIGHATLTAITRTTILMPYF